MQTKHLAKEALASPAIQTLIDNMMETMVEYYGVGLAANQVHESLAIAVIESHGPRGTIPMTVLVNPEVTILDDSWLRTGKLSQVRISAGVCPLSELRVNALDRPGRSQLLRRFLCAVIQHEWDHLMGKVYLDRMHDLERCARWRLTRWLRRLGSEGRRS
jgi:peptide deformylase